MSARHERHLTDPGASPGQTFGAASPDVSWNASGGTGRGEALIAEVEAAIATAQEEIPDDAEPPRAVLLYLRGAEVQMIAGAGTLGSELLEAAGAVDVAAESGIEGQVPITPEALVDAAPDVIVTTTDGLDSVGGVEGLTEIPGVAETPAAETESVLDFDDQYLLGGGPRR